MLPISQDIRYSAPNINNKDNPESFYGSIQKLSNSKGFVTGNGSPAELLSAEQVYLDVLSGDWWRLENGVNQSFFSNTAGNTGSEYFAGQGISIDALKNISMDQTITESGDTGILPYVSIPLSGGSSAVVRKITNNDTKLTVTQDATGSITIDNNSLIETVNQGSNITVSLLLGGKDATVSVNDDVNLASISKIGPGALVVEGSFFNGGNITAPSINNSQTITTSNRQLVSNNGILQWHSYTKTVSDVCQNIGVGSGLEWFGNSVANPAPGNAWGCYSTEGVVRLQQISARIVDSVLYQFAPTGTLVLELGYIPQGSNVADVNFNLIWNGAFSSGVNMPSIDFDFSQVAAPLPSVPNGCSLAFRLNKTNLTLLTGTNNAECTVQLIYN